MRSTSLIFITVAWTVLLCIYGHPVGSEEPKFRLPSVGDPSGQERKLSSSPRIYVFKFKFVGNTVFPDEELSLITKSYENRRITSEELQEVRHKLTLYYVDRKYINSGVVIPDQKVENGIITLKIIEGRLVKIDVSGNKRLRSKYISDRIALGAGPPLNTNVLQEQLQLIHQNSLIKRINAEINPGINPGEDELKVKVEEERPYFLGLQFKNNRSPSVGELELEIHAAHGNVTGRGDSLGLKYDLTEGLDEFVGYYILPLNARNTTMELSYEKIDATVIEEPFNEIDITSDSNTYRFALNHPVLMRPGNLFSLSLSAEKRHSETSLLGIPFSFSPGVQNGESDVTVLRFAQYRLLQKSSQVLAFRSVFNWGIDALGATDNDSGPDGQFFVWLGQFKWVKRLIKFRESQMVFRTDVQLAADPLLPLEKFAVGGYTSVRGYRINRLVRDNGVVLSLELRIPVFRLSLPQITRTVEEGMLQFALFTDYGRAWNTDLPTPDLTTLFSVGPGLRWNPSSRIHAYIYWGIPLRNIETSSSSLQDTGIHFELGCRFF